MLKAIAVCGCVVLGMTTVNGRNAGDGQPAAQELWEQAVAAKGGRERLRAVDSFAIHEKTVFAKPVRGIAEQRVDQLVCELPDLCWEFLDYRPGKMGYTVRVVNARTGQGWASHGAPASPFRQPDTSAAFRLRQLQYLYFLETRWVKPTPLRASRVRLGSRAIDRLETLVEDEPVVYFLDAVTHLPVRVEATHQWHLPPPRPGMKPPGPTQYTYELGNYHDVAGIQVPARIRRGNDSSDAQVEVNPPYDPSLFTTPPSPDATVDSWRARTTRRPSSDRTCGRPPTMGAAPAALQPSS